MTAATALSLAACKPPASAPEPVRSVKLITVATSSLQAEQEFSAEVRAQVESRLAFRVTGKLVTRQAEMGQRVGAGQVLAQLDPQDFQLSADAALAQLAAATTQRDLAQADLKRFVALKDQNFISGAELERRETTLKAAQAQVDQAQAQSQAQVHQATYTRLQSTVAGVITAVEAEPGQVVAAGTPVLRLAHDGPRDAVFSVPEDRVAAMRLGTQVRVRNWSDSQIWTGRVRQVSASADPATRTYLVKVGLPPGVNLPLGATLAVLPQALSSAGTPVIKLPLSALRQDGGGSAVWVLDPASMTVRSQAVQVGQADGNELVVNAGLTPGMQVVAAGVHVLSAGQKVSVFRAAP